jgi:hypothetical protein
MFLVWKTTLISIIFASIVKNHILLQSLKATSTKLHSFFTQSINFINISLNSTNIQIAAQD